jgi:hypothetical protein
MGFTLNALWDYSKVGQDTDSGTPDYNAVHATAVSEMEADFWSRDAYALGNVTNKLALDWSGRMPHLVYDSPSNGGTYHLLRKAAGSNHLLRGEPYVSYCSATTTAIANSYDATSYEGTSVTKVELEISSANWPAGEYARVSFRTNATGTPDDAWSWVTDSPVYLITPPTAATWYTFVTSITLQKYFFVVMSFSTYSVPVVPLTDLMTNTVEYSVGWTNTAKFNY